KGLNALEFGGRERDGGFGAFLLRFKHGDLLAALLRRFEPGEARARLGDLGRGSVHIGGLQIRIEPKQRHADRDLVAFTHGERLDPPGLIGADEDEIGLDPALERGLLAVVATREYEGRGERAGTGDATCRHVAVLMSRFSCRGSHVAVLLPNRISIWAPISSRTSSGAKRSNRELHTMATSAGAIMSCGKRASASLAS